MRWIVSLVALALISPPAPAQTAPRGGEELIGQMHDRYAKTWYHTLTFVQRTTRPGRPDATWYETSSVPGRLRIDVAPMDSGNAILFLGDSVHNFRRGRPARVDRDRNLLMTLGFDVYGQPAVTTVTQLREEHIDLAKIRDDTWQGRPVWVVGASAGDSTSNQFWIDKERLLFVRLLQLLPGEGAGRTLEAQFNQYQPLAGGWIAVNVVAKMNGVAVQTEHYTDVQANVPLDETVWDTKVYHRPAWVK